MRTLYISALLLILNQSLQLFARRDNLILLQSLKGTWLFSIGIDDKWISPGFDDSEWETIRVPSAWEEQGYNGYNGYAFYRKKIIIPSNYKRRMLYLYLGYIDDVDEVYMNGHKIGSSGNFPPNYVTAYNAERNYYVPEEYINFDRSNIIVVKVYDSFQAGGIVGGEIGLYAEKKIINIDVNLQTTWRFKVGDDLRYKESDFNDNDWDEIFVPAKWEDQGYRNYDGYAWYRKSFIYHGKNSNEKMVIMMGKIDDIDQVYINGTLVGSTGNFPSKPNGKVCVDRDCYNAFRGYYLPAGLLKKRKKNVIAVRVFDIGFSGGIYEGPVGVITQSQYTKYWRK